MSKYLKLFENHTQYETFIGGGGDTPFVKPNVSHCIEENEVHYNPIPIMTVKYNVTDTSSQTKLCNRTGYFSVMEIDGVVQPSVVSEYTFSTTGEHIVKYTLVDDTTIGNNAFQYCSDITSVTIPNSVKSIGNNAFQGCHMTSVTIPNSVTSIGVDAFSNCSGLTSVTIGNSVTSIGVRAFSTCTSLTSVTIPNSVTSIGGYAFGGCTGLTSVTIGNSVTSIVGQVFQGCTGLTSVTIGNSVTSIGDRAFQNCTSLTSVTIPNSVTNIESEAFSNCSGLTSVTIGNSVTSIGNTAFINCTSLTSIVSLATTAPTIGSNTFNGIKTNGTLTVPSGSTGYDVWMGTGNYYLGKYNWTKVEQ